MSLLKLAETAAPSNSELAARSEERVEVPRSPLAVPSAQAWLLAAGCWLLAVLPLLGLFSVEQHAKPHYQFAPFAVVLAAVLAWRDGRRLGPLTPGAAERTGPLLLWCAAGLLVAVLFRAPFFGAAVVLLLVGTLIYDIGGARLFRALVPAWVLLWLAVPLPFGGDGLIVQGLQAATSFGAGSLLDALGTYYLPVGSILEVPSGMHYAVTQGYGGIGSLLPILITTVFFVFWTRRPVAHAVLLIVAAIGWGLAANALHLAAVVYLDVRWSIHATSGWAQLVLGLTLFAGALAMIYSTDRLLRFFNTPRSAKVPRADCGVPTTVPRLAESRCLSRPMMAAFGTFGLVQAVFFWWPAAPESPAAILEIFQARPVHQSDLPDHWQSLRLERFVQQTLDASQPDGDLQHAWIYTDGPLTVTVALDYPHEGWSDLTSHYGALGWDLQKRQREPLRNDDGGEGQAFSEAWFAKPVEQYGWLLFSLIDEHGQLLNPPRVDVVGETLDRLAFWQQPWKVGSRIPWLLREGPAPAYRIQLWAVSDQPLTNEQRASLQEWFVEIRDKLQKRGSGESK